MGIQKRVNAILDPCQDGTMRIFDDRDLLLSVVVKLRSCGYEIVVTSAVCDLAHDGHARYFEAAHKLSDNPSVLIVCVESDALVRGRKGDGRPIIPFENRISLVASLRSVHIATKICLDELYSFKTLLELLRPDILVASHTTPDVSDEERGWYELYCRKVCYLGAQGALHTTDIIRRIVMSTERN